MFPFGKGPGPAELRERQLDPTHLSVKMGPEGVAVRRCCHMHHSLHMSNGRNGRRSTLFRIRYASNIVVPARTNRFRDTVHDALS